MKYILIVENGRGFV